MSITPTAYVLPPINADAINTTTERFGITDAMLTSSSVPETAPAAYAGGTTYAMAAQASTGTAGQVLTVYQSLQASNTGHTPSSSPTWWANIGTTYSVWASGTWATGDMVIVVATHSVYQRTTVSPGASAVSPGSDTTGMWIRISTTNRWAMFDMLSATGTTVVSPLTLVLAPGRMSGLALLGIEDGGNVTLSMVSGATTVYSPAVVTLDNAVIASLDDYFFSLFDLQTSVFDLGIPTYTDGVLTITVTGGSAFVVGKCVVGTAVPVGITEEGPRVRDKSFSVTVRNDFGDLTDITKRKSIPLVSQTVMVEKASLRSARDAFKAARTCPCVFIGLNDASDDFADLVNFLGICTDVEAVPKNSGLCPINAEIEGI